jgi:hypothetical protein
MFATGGALMLCAKRHGSRHAQRSIKVNGKHSIAAAIAVMLIGAFASVAADTKGGSSDTVAAITQLENDSIKAFLGKPREFLQKNVAEDFVGGTSFGKWETKADMLKDADNSANKTNSMSARDLKVHAYGNAAVARYTLAYDDVYKGEHRARTVLCTDTWVKQSGAWMQVAAHCSQTK